MAAKSEWAKKCMLVLKGVKQHKHAWIFGEPVDAEKLQIPDYHNVIKRPMDLGTVKTRLDGGSITSPEQFKDEVLLTFRNAMSYNPPQHDVHIMAKTVMEAFLQKWDPQEAVIMEKWRTESSGGFVGGAVASPAEGSVMAGKRHLEANFDDDRAMSYEEKRELSANMNKLPGKKLGSVVQIIHDRNPKILQQNGEDPDEIEIDIDKIDHATLRYLDTFVKEALAKNKKKKTG